MGAMNEQIEAVAASRAISPFRLVSGDRPPVSESADEELMFRHAEGCEHAFGELVRRHQKGVLNYMFRMVQNRHVAEELTQEVFMALVKNAQRYQPTAKFTTYLYTIASNIVSKEWARQKRRPRLFNFTSFWGRDNSENEMDPLESVGDERANIVDAFQQEEVSQAVNDALKYLPEHQREAFVLRRFQDLSYQEIADITEVPVGTVKSRVVRAERALRPHLERFREYVS